MFVDRGYFQSNDCPLAFRLQLKCQTIIFHELSTVKCHRVYLLLAILISAVSNYHQYINMLVDIISGHTTSSCVIIEGKVCVTVNTLIIAMPWPWHAAWGCLHKQMTLLTFFYSDSTSVQAHLYVVTVTICVPKCDTKVFRGHAVKKFSVIGPRLSIYYYII